MPHQIFTNKPFLDFKSLKPYSSRIIFIPSENINELYIIGKERNYIVKFAEYLIEEKEFVIYHNNDHAVYFNILDVVKIQECYEDFFEISFTEKLPRKGMFISEPRSWEKDLEKIYCYVFKTEGENIIRSYEVKKKNE